MRRMEDPFPPTPEGFHLRLEATLELLEERDMSKRGIFNKTALLAAAIVAALLAATAIAAVVGNTRFKDALNESGAAGAAKAVMEPHTGVFTAEGFGFSIDELVWEEGDLWFTYTLSVPDEGRYLAALYTPTLNGEPMAYDAKGFQLPKFFDREGNPALLLGVERGASCTELLTFTVDPALTAWRNNRLAFRAAILKTEADFEGKRDFSPLLDPPEYVDLADEGLTSIDALVASGKAKVVSEPEIRMTLDGTVLAGVRCNDVRKRDFDLDGVHIRIERFALSRTGAFIEYDVSCPGVPREAAMAALKRFLEATEGMSFATADGRPLGYTLGESGGAGLRYAEDGSPYYRVGIDRSAMISVEDVEQVVLAPVRYPEDASGNQLAPVYDMDRAIVLTPTVSPAPADDEEEPLC